MLIEIDKSVPKSLAEELEKELIKRGYKVIKGDENKKCLDIFFSIHGEASKSPEFIFLRKKSIKEKIKSIFKSL